MKFHQTQAALILEKNLPLIKQKCQTKYDIVSFVQNLCAATYLEYSVEELSKDDVNFSYTSAGYFLIENFNSTTEHEICSGLYLGIVKPNKADLTKYFGEDISSILNISTRPAFRISTDYYVVPDISQSIITDLVEIFKRFKQKRSVITPNQIREMLVYYTIYLFNDYYKSNNEILHSSVMNMFLQQVDYAKNNVFHHFSNYYISPEVEVMEYIKNSDILTLEEKYFKYIFS